MDNILNNLCTLITSKISANCSWSCNCWICCTSKGTKTFDYSFAFSNKNAGTNKTVTVTGLSLTGTSAGNYQLTTTAALTTAASGFRLATVTVAAVDQAPSKADTVRFSLLLALAPT
mgnify:CR=1 FL=1